MKLGIDFGGTKTEIIAINDVGKELYRLRVPTPRDDYAKTIESFVDLVAQAEKVTGQKCSLGVGIPGNIAQDTGIIKSANTTWIVGKPFKKDLEAALDRNVKIDNDANCFAVSEAADGAGKGKAVVFASIIGTGFGGGLALNGKSWPGHNEIAGEWGHNPLPFARVYREKKQKKNVFLDHPNEDKIGARQIFEGKDEIEYITHDPAWNEHPGPMCYCGKRGCLERWVSGTGLKRDYFYVTGEERSTHEIIANAQKGEPKATAAFDRYVDRLARAYAFVINILDPDVIVVGGGMSSVEKIYEDVPKIWGKYIYAQAPKTKLLPARHGDSSGIRGAAWL